MLRSHFVSVGCLFLSGVVATLAQTPVTLNVTPSRIVGHPNPEQNTLASANPNLVEGRELYYPYGIALDTSVSPPALYVADTSNNRVLGWKDATSFTNGQKADLVIGQLSGTDFYHTVAGGPGTTLTAGLTYPTGVTVSASGDLYIADSGNNRVLRFRKPFQNADRLFPDLFIGQPNLNSRTANNNGTGKPGASGLSFSASGQVQSVGLSFDSAGNLWLTDPGNQRVLRFAASDLSGGGGPLTANLVLGNLGLFTSVQPPVTASIATTTNLFAIPSTLAFDSAGRLFVADGDNNGFGRVMVFVPPFANGIAASRIMGVFPSSQTQPTTDQISKTVFSNASSIFFVPGTSPKVGLVDSGDSRVLLFDSYDRWPDAGTSFSPQATAVIGQPSFTSLYPNSGSAFLNPPSSNLTLSNPSGAAFANGHLYVADTSNHRVLDFPLQTSGAFGAAARVLGQDRFDMRSPNLIEGKEFAFYGAAGSGGYVEGGIAIDASGDTPHLYVADYFNNRVLGFKDFRSLAAGSRADLVIGQVDFNSGLCNGNGDQNHLSASTLCFPAGVVTDSQGNLYVADSGNGRVLRFPAPFAHTGLQSADLVLGQHTFTSKITDPSQFTMSAPYGVAIMENNGLLVSDRAHNRVLFFPFTNGKFDAATDMGRPATKVFGQPDFNTITPGSTDSKMNTPSHVAADAEARPYVVDTGNNRVMIFDQIQPAASGASAVHILAGLNSPRGVYVNQLTGEAWVTNSNSGTVVKYPKYAALLFSDTPNFTVESAAATIAVAQDPYGDLVVADSSNRVGFYFPGLQALNGGSFIPSFHLAPGMFAAICAANSNCSNGAALFGANTVDNSTRANPLPLPTSLDNVRVTVSWTDADGNLHSAAAPLYYVSPTQINFYVPMGTPTSGTANVEVVQTTTGRVYAASPVAMTTYSPAVLMTQYSGKMRQAQVLNQDNTANSPANPAARGSVVQIFLVGQGFIPNAPTDGMPAPSSPVLTTPFIPRVAFNGLFTDEYKPGVGDPSDSNKFVLFSGLTPGAVGLWQINVQVPANVTPGSQISLIVNAGSVLSTDGSFLTTIAVK